jgi:Uncharacterised protein family (UPF0236)
VKEIRISLKLRIALGRRDVHGLEDALLKAREEAFLGILRRVLEAVEAEALRGRRLCSGCGGEEVRNGRAAKRLRTLLGEVRYRRVRLRCRGCGRERFPLDEALRLEGGEGTTLGVRERSLWAAVELSYEKAHEFLRKYTGLEVSRKKIYSMAIEEGQRIAAWEERRRQRVFQEGDGVEVEKKVGTLYIQVDGTAVNDREERDWMECKVGASFSRRVKISKDRVWLADKRTYAGVESPESFGEKFFLDCVAQGVMGAERVIFISDGAKWIRKLKEDYFPGALGVLDLWHLERELRLVLGVEREGLVASLKGLALEGKGQEIVNSLMRETRRCFDPRQAAKILQTAGYVMSNLDWIENIPKADGYGSGPVEKTVDITVARRFKRRGMSWLRARVNPLLKLRLLKLNNEWDQYWQERREALAQCAA